MWKVIIDIVLNIIKSKVLHLTRASIKGLRQIKTITKWVRNYNIQKQILLASIRHQKEVLLRGSFKDKTNEYFSNAFITKFLNYRAIQNDVEKSEYQKKASKVDMIFSLPLIKDFKAIKQIWKKQLQLQNQYKKFLDRFEREIQREISKNTQRKWKEFLKETHKSWIRQQQYERYQRQNALLMEKEQERLQRELLKNKQLLKKTLISLAKKENNVKLSDRKNNINTFNDFLNKLSPKEKQLFEKEINSKWINKMSVKFNSKWIDCAIFIPHFEQREYHHQLNKEMKEKIINSKTRGFMKIKVKKPSKRNPSGIYAWWNVKYSDWLNIINDPTGTNFWDVWYKKNRKNMIYLLPQSIYWRKVRAYKPRPPKKKKRGRPKKTKQPKPRPIPTIKVIYERPIAKKVIKRPRKVKE